MNHWCVFLSFLFPYNIDPPINNNYNEQREALGNIIHSLSRAQIHYINYVLDLSSAGLILGLPTSPTHVFLALKLQGSYWDPEFNMIYVYFNASRSIVFLDVLFRALGRAHLYSISRKKDSFFFPLALDVYSYFVSFSMGIRSISWHQAEKLVGVFSSRSLMIDNLSILNSVVAKTLGWILSKYSNFDIHTLARVLGGSPEKIIEFYSELEDEGLKKVWQNAVDSFLRSKDKTLDSDKAEMEMLFSIISEDELDKLTYDIVVALAGLIQYIRIRGSGYVRAKYSWLLDKLTSFEPLKSYVLEMIQNPESAISRLDNILPGTKNIVGLMHPEVLIENVFIKAQS